MTETKTCTVCGAEYGRKRHIGKRQWENSKFCGYDCYWASKRSKSPPKPCGHCGKMMVREPGAFSDRMWEARKFCSKECADPSRFDRAREAAKKNASHEDKRLWARVDKRGLTDCWEWQGACNTWGYGVINSSVLLSDRSRVLATHRLAYELTHGPIPDGKLVRHLCDNRKCCNPAHLALGSYKDNYEDARKQGRHTYGARQANAKLTDESAMEIFLADGTQEKIAERFGVSRVTVSQIKNKRVWKHIHS